MQNLLIALFYITFPLIVIYLCYRFQFMNKIGAVVICYIVGITIGNIGILPDNVFSLQESISETAVALSLPLLLFSMDVKRWSRLAGRTILSMAYATIAIIIVAAVGYFFIRAHVNDAWQLAGMSVGVYTGGTPNLAAIKTALGIDSTRFLIVHTYDTIFSIFFIIFSITVAQRFFKLFLPAFGNGNNSDSEDKPDLETEDVHAYAGIFRGTVLLQLLMALLLSGAIVGLSLLASKAVPKDYATSVIILLITTLGIGASFIQKIRALEKTFQFGMYVIYIFCLVVGSMANYKMIINIDIAIMIYVIISILGSMIIHFGLCKLSNIDTDTYIITSVSAICSPPFVPVVAGALKNREIILSGLTTGIIGYAIGNYLGIGIAYLLRTFF